MMTVSEKLEKARQARAAKAQAGIKLTKRNVVEIWSEDKLSLRRVSMPSALIAPGHRSKR